MASIPQLDHPWQAPPLPHVEQLRSILRDEFIISFHHFTTSWSENCFFSFSPTVASTVRELLSLFEEQDIIEIIAWILQFVDSTLIRHRYFVLMHTYNGEELLSVILAVLDYLKDAFATIAGVLNVDTRTQIYRDNFGLVQPSSYLLEKVSEIVFSRYQERTMNAILAVVEFWREIHFYHNSAFWNSIADTSVGRVAALLRQSQGARRRIEFVQRYESILFSAAKAHVENIPLTTSEIRFLVMVEQCFDVEKNLYNTLVSADVEAYENYNRKLLDLFRDEHQMRRARQISRSRDHDLVNPQARFRPVYYRYFFALYIFRGDELLIDNFRNLCLFIRHSFVRIVRRHVNRLGEEVSDSQSLESFKVALQELSNQKDLIRYRLLQISNRVVFKKALEIASSEISRCFLSTEGYEYQLRAAENHAINFLCDRSIRGNNELMFVTLVVDFFSFFPRRSDFLVNLYMQMRIKILQGIFLPMNRLRIFTSWINADATTSELVERVVRELDRNRYMLYGPDVIT